ncbi:glycoside hydrolase family 3 protein [Commensalibacter papalotli (ex Botero et al. 2024)]|uniref:Periplasmic beta-glucosidase and related glycosidases (BglX) (PDB:2X40) n=1 Tax=Commensalibacter papalotli (ex Botero et al. 2024) TaxID=2972766 RepID=A0ABN8WCW4_9PROT|nr:glycoside hydrolase family 3 C-terminal domain-containing protein [Commensalibacter papalotli (ex Botero et al. 2024)]CAI3957035.1 Periplasmic beta-glucosidase and related glycosidases (BglX) (PDB:2X40) [Commensalibacter papalotli (ex Botero et al. 2024)]CAI3957659.1 Periplasmic beta-glucosidase and related glycosidases (BglX) (PDB:2X40) [Commensalibacter papalotli (ex Botero et al. 2024)]
MKLSQLFLLSSILVTVTNLARAEEVIWKDTSLSPEARAKALVKAMTQDEKLQLVHSLYAVLNGPKKFPIPKGALGSAAYVPGIKRLGIPAQQITDAGLGVTNPGGDLRPGDAATSLPSGQILSGTFDSKLAYEAGKVTGAEAFHKGFNVLLGGGAVLVRDPRNGRNFEYLGEDPILVGNVAAQQIKGVQSQHVVSTVKHYAFNNIETNRLKLDMKVGEKEGRESDLLAFETVIKKGNPGSIMCAYNKVNGDYACENSYLLQLPKKEWGYQGYMMTDWGAGHSTVKAANAGLDQESAADQFDNKIYFGKDLKEAIAKGEVPQSRLDDMAYRVLYGLIQVGAYDHPATKSEQPENVAIHEAISQKIAENGIVLLQNKQNILPLATTVKNIAIIGGHANEGVLSGGGSSQVTARGGNIKLKTGMQTWPGPESYFPSSPMKTIQALAPEAKVQFAGGDNIQQAVDLAKNSDVVIIFATKWSAEAFDNADLSLPGNQNQLIEAVAKAGKPVVVVLETGNPVEMPWLNNVDAVVEAWFPGTSGGTAIANVLFGKVNPSGRLTTTWPKSLSQVPYPTIKGAGRIINADPGQPMENDSSVISSLSLDIDKANVGYRWYQDKKITPLYPFGYGLSYTTFKYTKITLNNNLSGKNPTMTAEVTVENTGKKDGADAVQVYGTMPDGTTSRLLGFDKVALKAGETKTVSIPLALQAIANYEPKAHHWELPAGTYTIAVKPDALSNEGVKTSVHLNKMNLTD